MLDLEPRLDVQVIWFDTDVVKLRIAAFSEHFAGRADVYASHEQLANFAADLSAFPLNLQDHRVFEFATSARGNRVSLTFFVVNSLGLSAVDVEIGDNETSGESALVRVFVEAVAVDEFITQLRAIAAACHGTAALHGRAGVLVAKKE